MMLNGYLLFTGSGGGSPVINQILLSDVVFELDGEIEAVVDTAETQAEVEGEATAVVETGEIQGEVDC